MNAPTSLFRMRCRLRRLLPALVLVAAACTAFRRGGTPPEPALIYFANESLDQADVYAVAQSGDYRRIGTVMSGRVDTLTVPASMLASGGSINIYVRLLASSRRPETGPVTIIGGEAYLVRLPSDERLLSFLPAIE
jgi:hypothetical protein